MTRRSHHVMILTAESRGLFEKSSENIIRVRGTTVDSPFRDLVSIVVIN